MGSGSDPHPQGREEGGRAAGHAVARDPTVGLPGTRSPEVPAKRAMPLTAPSIRARSNRAASALAPVMATARSAACRAVDAPGVGQRAGELGLTSREGLVGGEAAAVREERAPRADDRDGAAEAERTPLIAWERWGRCPPCWAAGSTRLGHGAATRPGVGDVEHRGGPSGPPPMDRTARTTSGPVMIAEDSCGGRPARRSAPRRRTPGRPCATSRWRSGGGHVPTPQGRDTPRWRRAGQDLVLGEEAGEQRQAGQGRAREEGQVGAACSA